MSRFEFRGKYAMRVQKEGKLLAYFTVVDTEIGVEFSDMKLISGTKGVFVSSPNRTYQKDGKDVYADYIRAAWNNADETRDERGVAYFEEMAKAAYAYYESQGGKPADSTPSASSGSAPRRSARGPVPTVSGSIDNAPKGKKLPF
jgi:DNA-binding cell septation regulator SpoVG